MDTILLIIISLVFLGILVQVLVFTLNLAAFIMDVFYIAISTPVVCLVVFTLLLNAYFLSVIYILVCWLPIKLITSNWLKGKVGEYKVSNVIKTNFNDLTLVNDVTLPTENGTTQIDHIVISKYGIFVIETKNFRGKIFGSSHDNTWTQKIGGATFKFYNPMKQNSKHIDELSRSLSVDRMKFVNIIVFTQNNLETKYKLPNTVTTLNSFSNVINEYSALTFTSDEIAKIEAKINSVRMKPGLITDFKHALSLKVNRLKSFSLKRI